MIKLNAEIRVKQNEYWDHFVEQNKIHSFGFTKVRLQKAKKLLWDEFYFWEDTLDRHSGMDMTPEEMKKKEFITYEHCISNMAGMIVQALIKDKIIR